MGNAQTAPGKYSQLPSLTCKMSGEGCVKKTNTVQPPNVTSTIANPLILNNAKNSHIVISKNVHSGGRKKNTKRKTKTHKKGRK